MHRFGRHPITFVDDQLVGPGRRGREWAYHLGEEIVRRKIGAPLTCCCRVNDIDEDLFGCSKRRG